MTGLVWFGLVWLDIWIFGYLDIWFGLVWFGLVGLVRIGSVWLVG